MLSGSAENVLGRASGSAGSLAPAILALLGREPDWIRKALEAGAAIALTNLLRPGVGAEEEALERAADLVENSGGALQEVEFLAKRLASGRTTRHTHDPSQEISVFLGTPLFVAQAD